MSKTSLIWLTVGAVLSPILLTVGHIVVYALGMVVIIGAVLFILGKLAENDQPEE
jgi:hypothetical protein